MRSLSKNSRYAPETFYSASVMATVIVSTAGAVVAQDYPSDAAYFHVSADARLFLNLRTTEAAVLSATIAATTATTGLNILVNSGHEHIYEIPTGSTGYSMTAESSAMATIEFWSK